MSVPARANPILRTSTLARLGEAQVARLTGREGRLATAVMHEIRKVRAADVESAAALAVFRGVGHGPLERAAFGADLARAKIERAISLLSANVAFGWSVTLALPPLPRAAGPNAQCVRFGYADASPSAPQARARIPARQPSLRCSNATRRKHRNLELHRIGPNASSLLLTEPSTTSQTRCCVW
jgi:hypothetical protein